MGRLGFGHPRGLDYNTIKEEYGLLYPVTPNVSSPTVNNEDEALSFNWIHFVYFWIDMYELSGDSIWIDNCVSMCDHFLYMADSQRVARGELSIIPRTSTIADDQYYQAQQPYLYDEGDFVEGAPGWSSFDLSDTNLSVQILQDGQILGALGACADIILTTDILSSYNTYANNYLVKIKEVIDSHEWSWRYDKVAGAPSGYTVAGNWWYPNRQDPPSIQSGTLPFNHSAGALQSMIIYNEHIGDSEFVNKIDSFFEFTRKENLGEDYFSRREEDGAYRFPYNARTNTRYEDLNHGSYIFTMFKYSFKYNIGNITETELTRYVNSATRDMVWRNAGLVGEIGERFGVLDTSPYEIIPDAESFDPLHFSWMIPYSENDDLFKMLRDLHAVNNDNDSVGDSRKFRGRSALLLYKPDNVLY